MNKHLLSLVLAASCAAVFVAPQIAQAQPQKLYLRGNIGGNWAQSADLKEFFGPVAPGTKVKFDPGISLDVAAGYEFTDWFAGEMQTGVMANRIASITGASVHDAWFSNVPLLFNVRLQCPQPWRLVPYIGGGVGINASVIHTGHITLNGTTAFGDQSDVVFACQAFGGLRYKLNNHMSVGAEYRYYLTGDPRWEADDVFGTASTTMRMSGAEIHSVSLTFNYNF